MSITHRHSASNEVFEKMKRKIIDGEWPVGTKIPGELELSRIYGVSRISVRQAIHKFVGMGILYIRLGDGTYVSSNISTECFEVLLPYLVIEKPDMYEIFEYRSILESRSAALAAERATKDDILLLKDALRNIENNKNDYDKYIEYDLNFHTLIALATKNSVIVKITSILHDILRTAMRKSVEYTGVELGSYYHPKILEFIEKKDPKSASHYMEEHVESSIKILYEAGIVKLPKTL